MIYIYGLECPIENIIRYIGKSAKPEKRLCGHISSAMCGQYNHRTARWIRKLVRLSLEPRLVILHTVGEDERWQDVERDFIAAAATMGWRLTNSMHGGEGLDFIDPADDAAWRKKLSDKHKMIWSTPERRAEARERSLKAWSDPELSERRIRAVKLAHTRPDIKARNLEALAEIRANPLSVKKKSDSIRANWADPDGSAKRRAALSSEECRTKMSESAKSKWKDPVIGPRLRAAYSSAASRAKKSEAAKRRATPEYRAMMAAKTKAAWASGRRKKKSDVSS